MRTLLIVSALFALSMAVTPLYEAMVTSPPTPGVPVTGVWSASFTISPYTASLAGNNPAIQLWTRYTTWSTGRSINVTYYVQSATSTKLVMVLTSPAASSVTNEANTTLSLSTLNCSTGCVLQLDFQATCEYYSCINGISADFSPRVTAGTLTPLQFVYSFKQLPYPTSVQNMWTQYLNLNNGEYLYVYVNATSAITLQVNTRAVLSSFFSSFNVMSGGNTITAPTSNSNKWVTTANPENKTFLQGVNYIGITGSSSFSSATEFQFCVGNCPSSASAIVPLFSLLVALVARLF